MSTASTKSRSRKNKRSTGGVAPRVNAAGPAAAGEFRPSDLSERTWLIFSLTILAAGTVLRLYHLNLVPFHHDEGVNGNFLVRLVREGIYHYDPANYHGPTLYYFAAIVPWTLRFLFGPGAQNTYGLNTATVRLVPALFGLATIWLVLLLRRRLGTVGTLCAAALLATSPGAVYLSRYFIHETLFVFFALAIVVAGLKYYDDGHLVYLILTSISAALLFATKETAIISVLVIIVALASTHIYRRLRNEVRSRHETERNPRRSANQVGRIEQSPGVLERLGGPGAIVSLGLGAVAIFLALNVLFYSSFFTNYPKGAYDALKTFEFWTKTGKEAHVHPLATYVYWLLRQESPLLVPGLIGAALAVWKPRNAFALFSALWAFGLLAAYSLIAYKTPWLALNFIVPLALIAGYAMQTIWEGRGQRHLTTVLLVIAIGISGYQTIDLNFFNYDNDAQYYVYVYAHTRRETLALVDEIDRVAERTKQGGQTGITVVSPDYWPLPWYLRDFARVGYHGRMSASSEPVIIASESQGAEVQSTFGDQYEQVTSGFNSAGSYPLRPGVSLLLYVRRDAL